MDITPLVNKLDKILKNKIVVSPIKMVGLCCQPDCDTNTNIFIKAIGYFLTLTHKN